MKEIPLTQGKFTLVDDEDYDFLMQWRWQCAFGYARRTQHIGMTNGKEEKICIHMHRVINNTPDGMHTDHIDGNRLNNQKLNLRNCTQSQNAANRKLRLNTSSKYKGVSWAKNVSKWQSYIKVNYKRINLGYFR